MPEVAMPDVVYTQRCGAITRITMNRPEHRNAQNSAMTYALDDAFYAAADDEVKVIILAGEGRHFSAGHARSMRDTGSARDAMLTREKERDGTDS